MLGVVLLEIELKFSTERLLLQLNVLGGFERRWEGSGKASFEDAGGLPLRFFAVKDFPLLLLLFLSRVIATA